MQKFKSVGEEYKVVKGEREYQGEEAEKKGKMEAISCPYNIKAVGKKTISRKRVMGTENSRKKIQIKKK